MEKKIITDEAFLKKRSVNIDLASPELQKILDDLEDTAEAHRNDKAACVGLAANQIGHLFRVMVIKKDHWYEPIVNPKIIKKGGRVIRMGETCLSKPGEAPIPKMRSQRITIEHTDFEGNVIKETFHGFNARIIQHEMDHFEGKLI